MEQANWFIIPIAAFVPLLLGYIWYHPNVLGNRLAQHTSEATTPTWTIGKIALIYLLSFMMAYVLTLMSVHQSAIFQLFFMDPDLADANSEYSLFVNDFMEKYGDRHRSFGHGIIHGAEAGLMFGLAFLGIPTLIQGKSFKPVWIHLGFLMLCAAIMGGLACAYF